MKRLDAIYDTAEAKQEEILNQSKEEMKGYIEEIRKAAAAAQAKQPTGKADVRVEASGVSTTGQVSVAVPAKKTKKIRRKKS